MGEPMEAYTSFAMVYDELMDNIPYCDWGAYLVELLQEYQILPGMTVTELGCGTGKMTRILAQKGYRMLGIDLSEEMLMIARDKQMNAYYEQNHPIDFERQSVTDQDHILYVQQDMCELELNGQTDAFVSICDSMNYLLEDAQMLAALCRVREYLKPGGVFVFDLKTPYFYREVCADNNFCEDREEVSFIWENYYDRESAVNEYALNLFVKSEKHPGYYQKFQEYHYQRAYTYGEMQVLLDKAGLQLLHRYQAFTREEPQNDTERVYYVVQKK